LFLKLGAQFFKRFPTGGNDLAKLHKSLGFLDGGLPR
jgi:hypothetical protein